MNTNNEKISNLIIGYLRDELTHRDRQELEEWLKIGDNQRLFGRIIDKQNLIEQSLLNDEFDAAEAWNKMEAHLRPQRKIGWWLFYAAAVLVPLVLFFSVYILSDDAGLQGEYVEGYKVKPGEAKAVLTLHDGSTVGIASADTLIDLLKSGTHIKLDSLGANYTSSNTGHIEKLRYNTMVTPRGSEFKLTLEDGTKVWMNAESQLRYPERFVENTREVYVKGEVFFEVAKDTEKSFFVHFNDKRVKVLGTEFNVRCYEDESSDVITLVEGCIALDSKRESVILSPDQQAVIGLNDKKIAISNVDAKLFAAWKDGKFVYNNTPLETIMKDLSRWYQLNIFYQNANMKNKRFSLYTMRYDSIEEMLEILEATNKVKFEIFEDNIAIKSID
ncbi:FecR family protein [Carboxylicivirga marina]|uniref:FecR domain-containing protein n=1 Tax=Carboxylicivirga marina TaxID=2800988 RepID=A0ABS1HFZ2_9BACT|nr:FecR family protein [Carboxylicivirga marina]MBK3516487.1 FecR domain-containing protein [Carboxylicivirga marina]